MPQADLPFEPEVDREAAERHRQKRLRVRRLIEAKRELRQSAKRADDAPPIERFRLELTVGEKNRIRAAAREADLSMQSFLRAAALHFVAKLRRTDAG